MFVTTHGYLWWLCIHVPLISINYQCINKKIGEKYNRFEYLFIRLIFSIVLDTTNRLGTAARVVQHCTCRAVLHDICAFSNKNNGKIVTKIMTSYSHRPTNELRTKFSTIPLNYTCAYIVLNIAGNQVWDLRVLRNLDRFDHIQDSLGYVRIG